MIPAELIADISRVQAGFIEAVGLLDASRSVRSLPESAPFREVLRKARRVAEHPLLGRPCDGRVVCVFIGASGHGKTTFLNELFPDLGRRGWLVMDESDTTAQSLRIEYADGPARLGQVVVNSWTFAQIKRLVENEAARKQNDHDKIRVQAHDQEGFIEVSRTDSRLGDLDQFRFGPGASSGRCPAPTRSRPRSSKIGPSSAP